MDRSEVGQVSRRAFKTTVMFMGTPAVMFMGTSAVMFMGTPAVMFMGTSGSCLKYLCCSAIIKSLKIKFKNFGCGFQTCLDK